DERNQYGCFHPARAIGSAKLDLSYDSSVFTPHKEEENESKNGKQDTLQEADEIQRQICIFQKITAGFTGDEEKCCGQYGIDDDRGRLYFWVVVHGITLLR